MLSHGLPLSNLPQYTPSALGGKTVADLRNEAQALARHACPELTMNV